MVAPNVFTPRMKVFYVDMEHKMGLPKNIAKGDWRGSGTHLNDLFDGLQHEVGELADELVDGTPESIVKECADVANFAMMIADKARSEL